jgi:Spy/CpxP family protein refolding chaperone
MNNRIIRTLFVAISLALASASVFASKDGCDHAWSAEHEYGGTARFEKHMAKLHDALKLTAAQETAWTEFSNKMKPVNMEKPGHQDWKNLSTPDRLDKILENMKSHEKQLTEHAATVRTFYGALTPDQQKIFDHQFQAYHHRHGHHSGEMNDQRSSDRDNAK